MTRVDINQLLDEMTLAEKVGQMTQVEKYSITSDEVAEHAIGSVLSGGRQSVPQHAGDVDPNGRLVRRRRPPIPPEDPIALRS